MIIPGGGAPAGVGEAADSRLEGTLGEDADMWMS